MGRGSTPREDRAGRTEKPPGQAGAVVHIKDRCHGTQVYSGGWATSSHEEKTPDAGRRPR